MKMRCFYLCLKLCLNLEEKMGPEMILAGKHLALKRLAQTAHARSKTGKQSLIINRVCSEQDGLRRWFRANASGCVGSEHWFYYPVGEDEPGMLGTNFQHGHSRSPTRADTTGCVGSKQLFNQAPVQAYVASKRPAMCKHHCLRFRQNLDALQTPKSCSPTLAAKICHTL